MTKGYLQIITVPVSGDIFINGEYRGTKNVNLQVDPGNYIVSFGNVDGYITPQSINAKVDSEYVTEITVTYNKI